ncbi:MAG: ABC transporter permease [Gammaproteobacteria bacterium]|nr:MAG: ABC transporter permease [Gammaproteobacteria bacterium]
MFFDIDKWQEIWFSLRQHKLRTALTAFGVFWGIFMLSLLIGAGRGLENGATSNLKKMPNAIFIWIQNPTQLAYRGTPLGRWVQLRDNDVDYLKSKLNTIEKIYPQNSVGRWSGTPAYTTYKNFSGSYSIEGSYQGLESLHQIEMIEGRGINTADETERRKVVIIGQKVKELLFKNGDSAIGAFINVAGINFQVIGIFKSSNVGSDGSDTEKLYMPNASLRYSYNQQSSIGSILIVPKPGVDAYKLQDDAINLLVEHHDVNPKDSAVFGKFNMQKIFDQVFGLFTGISVFSWIVAIGTIMAGAVGVSNIMLIVVKERTREIGLRKALGATPLNIVAMIVQESLVITVFAGYLGLVFGVLFLEIVNKALSMSGNDMFKDLSMDLHTGVVALSVLIVAGLIASLLPASKAAMVNPITALQDE